MASIDPMLIIFLLYMYVSTTEHPEFTLTKSPVKLVEER
jgi:hypothetical protein